jgi:hypothetical protein
MNFLGSGTSPNIALTLIHFTLKNHTGTSSEASRRYLLAKIVKKMQSGFHFREKMTEPMTNDNNDN